jgi:uncharacterized protein YwgA
MERCDWLLLAIGDRMEPIQIQKTLFKFAKESGAPEQELYTFIPYNWGPCSLEIYDDLGQLRDEGSIEFVPSGRGWNLYHLTQAGMKKADKLRKEANQAFIKKLDAARSYVTSRDFETLLSDIYREYPDFAAESLFKK